MFLDSDVTTFKPFIINKEFSISVFFNAVWRRQKFDFHVENLNLWSINSSVNSELNN